MIAFILVSMVFVGMFVYGGFFLKNKKKALTSPDHYDVNYVREKEMEIWGYYYTLPPEKVKPKSLPRGPAPGARVPPRPPSGTGGGSGNLISCATPGCPNMSTHNLCPDCRLAGKRERLYKIVEKDGRAFKARIPSDAPDNAYANVQVGGEDAFGNWMLFRWTDPASGKQMYVKSAAFPCERHEIRTANGAVVKDFFA